LAKADAIQGVQLEKAELGLQTAKVQKANPGGTNQQNHYSCTV